MARRRLDPVGSLLTAIANRLTEDIYIEMEPSLVRFRRGETTLALSPIVTVATTGEPRVLAVGERVAATEPIVEIQLFDPASPACLSLTKSDALEAFLRYAFRRLTKRSYMVRPRVQIGVTRALSEIFCGYDRDVLHEACITAGARECIVQVV